MSFGDPIELVRPQSTAVTTKESSPLQEHLNRTMFAINDVTSIFPSSILCMGLLGSEDHHLNRKDAENFLELSKSILGLNASRHQLDVLASASSSSQVEGFSKLPFVNRKFKKHRVQDGLILSFSELDIERSSYYKNNILHFFVLPSLLSNVLLESRLGRIEELHRFLDHMFAQLASKYFLPKVGNAKDYIDRVMGVLAKQELIVVNEQAYTVNFDSPHFSSLKILAGIGSEIVKEDLFEVFENFRRSYQRIDIDASVEVHVMRRTSPLPAQIVNVSDAGFFVKSQEPTQTGDLIQFYANGSDRPLHMGKVVRYDVDGFGVRSAEIKLSSSSEQERRSSPRIAAEVVGQIVVQRLLDVKAKLRNISSSGALIATDVRLRVGDRLQMTIRHELSAVRISGVVSRTPEAGLGVRFVDLRPEKEAELVLFIASVLNGARPAAAGEDSWAVVGGV